MIKTETIARIKREVARHKVAGTRHGNKHCWTREEVEILLEAIDDLAKELSNDVEAPDPFSGSCPSCKEEFERWDGFTCVTCHRFLCSDCEFRNCECEDCSNEP